MAKALNITGEKYGRLTAVCNTGRKSLRNYIWTFRCDCGTEVDVAAGEVRGGGTQSCGCLRKEEAKIRMNKIRHLGTEATIKHGMTGTPTFISWDSMKQRCLNSKHKSYKDYGGRGIKICNRWLESFENFFEDMGTRQNNTTLDRKDVNKNYEPSNCHWANGEQQGNNKRTSVAIEYEGRTQTPIQWAREFEIHPKVLLYRLKSGWNIKEALTMKVNHGNGWVRGELKL